MFTVRTKSATWAGHETKAAALKDAAERNAVDLTEGGDGTAFYVEYFETGKS